MISDWNQAIVDEFRANDGKIGGNFEGAPMVLIHHTGRKSGEEHIAPTMYMAAEDDDATVYVFASKAGAPTNPDWYYNLTASGTGSVEIGKEQYPVTVTELAGVRRDEVFAEQARRYPGFSEYEEKTRGIRTIPVLALKRA
jgi:deazaflavin-dependent oxidoreductase (nitroreductase family)